MEFSMNCELTTSRPECELLKTISPNTPVTECQVDSVIKPVPVDTTNSEGIKQERLNETDIQNTSSTDKNMEKISNYPLKVEGTNPDEMISSHFLEPHVVISEDENMIQDQSTYFDKGMGNAINDQKFRKLTYLENNGRIFPGIELSQHGQSTQWGQFHPAAWKYPPSTDSLIPFLCKQTIPESSDNLPSSEIDPEKIKQENKAENEQSPDEQNLTNKYLDKQRFQRVDGKYMFQCPQCPYTTPARANLKVHIMVHTGNKPYRCAQCDFKSTTSSNLKKHMREHTGERPYKCYECESTFKTPGSLKTHMLNHTGEKPFACPECDYKSTKSVNLKRHIMTHTGEKKYACTQCEYMCTGKKDLGRHMMVHTGEKPHSCPECGYACIQKGTLKMHILRHHT